MVDSLCAVLSVSISKQKYMIKQCCFNFAVCLVSGRVSDVLVVPVNLSYEKVSNFII